jgi:hypothetical protein
MPLGEVSTMAQHLSAARQLKAEIKAKRQGFEASLGAPFNAALGHFQHTKRLSADGARLHYHALSGIPVETYPAVANSLVAQGYRLESLNGYELTHARMAGPEPRLYLNVIYMMDPGVARQSQLKDEINGRRGEVERLEAMLRASRRGMGGPFHAPPGFEQAIQGQSVQIRIGEAELAQLISRPTTVTFQGLDGNAIAAKVTEMKSQDYLATRINAYGQNASIRYAPRFDREDSVDTQVALGLPVTSVNYDSIRASGRRLVRQGLVYVAGDRWVQLVTDRAGGKWRADNDMNAQQYQQRFNTHLNEGFILSDLNVTAGRGEPRFSAVWDQTPWSGFQARHNMTEMELQAESVRLALSGYHLYLLAGSARNGIANFPAAWQI